MQFVLRNGADEDQQAAKTVELRDCRAFARSPLCRRKKRSEAIRRRRRQWGLRRRRLWERKKRCEVLTEYRQTKDGTS